MTGGFPPQMVSNPEKEAATQKVFPFDDVIMELSDAKVALYRGGGGGGGDYINNMVADELVPCFVVSIEVMALIM